MLRRWWRYWFLIVLCLPAHAEISVPDATGDYVSLSRPATRVVTLAPFLTELLYSIGGGHRLVGVSAYSDYPPAARALPVVGDSRRIDLERIIALHPDLVLAWKSGNAAGDIERLHRLSIPVYLAEPRRLGDLPLLMQSLGRLLGSESNADAAAHQFTRGIDEMRRKYARRKNVSVFVQIAAHPLMTLNGDHLVSDVVRLCGGSNIFADAALIAPQISLESVIASDPDVVLIVDDDGDGTTSWRDTGLRAARAGHIFAVPPDLIVRPTVRLLEGAEQVCRDLDRARGH